MMLHSLFIYRQIARSRKQAMLFVLCVVLSMVILVALNGFSDSVDRLMQKDAKALHGGDIIIKSRFPFSEPLAVTTDNLMGSGAAKGVRSYGFYSMARSVKTGESLLAAIKVVEPGYPLYGKIRLKSKRAFGDVLKPGNLVVEQALLERLQLKVGDRLRVGKAELTISDILVSEPDRPVNVFSLGPRILVPSADLDSLDLLGKGSRVVYKILLKVTDATRLAPIAASLASAALKEQERVDTFRTARSRLKRFIDNLFFFLNLVGTFTLVLAGIGIYNSLAAFLKEKEETIARLRALGATSRFITVHYVAVLLLLGLVGTVGGICTGLLLQYWLSYLFAGLLPSALEVTISRQAVLQGFGLGLLIVTLFAFLPVYRLKDIKPAAILRKDQIRFRKNYVTYGVFLVILIFFGVLILDKMGEMKIGFYFILGITGLAGMTALATVLIFWAIKKIHIKSLVSRQALRGLFRPGNATRAVIITMTSSLTFIFSIYLIEQNLNEAYIKSYPPDAPNLFFLDIQPGQKQAFSRTMGVEAAYYPVIRAKLLSINNRPIDRQKERYRRGDNLGRTFNLTYRNHLIDNETVVTGSRIFPDNFDGIPVSVMDTIAEVPDPPMTVGDRIGFRIQGVPLTATITSIRSRTRESLKPFFYFLFPDSVLQDAPHTIFSALRVEKELIPQLRNRMVTAFPNVTVIDVTESAVAIADVLQRLSNIVRFFTFFSVLAGILLILSSVFATRFARVQEAVYYKILGARGRFILEVFTMENLFLVLISGGLALLFSQTGTWIVCKTFLNIPYFPFVGASLLLLALSVFLAVAAGLMPSMSIIRQKPMGFLKEQTDA